MQALLRMAIMVAGLLIIWRVARSSAADKFFTTIIKKCLARWSKLEVKDYAQLLEINRGYTIAEIEVEDGEWLCDKKLEDLALTREGVLILGVNRKGGPYLGAPRGDVKIHDGDVLVCYGDASVLEELSKRKSGTEGDDQHNKAAEKHKMRVEAESIRDRLRD